MRGLSSGIAQWLSESLGCDAVVSEEPPGGLGGGKGLGGAGQCVQSGSECLGRAEVLRHEQLVPLLQAAVKGGRESSIWTSLRTRPDV